MTFWNFKQLSWAVFMVLDIGFNQVNKQGVPMKHQDIIFSYKQELQERKNTDLEHNTTQHNTCLHDVFRTLCIL